MNIFLRTHKFDDFDRVEFIYQLVCLCSNDSLTKSLSALSECNYKHKFNGIFQGSFPGINNLNACGNTVQENRHRLAVPRHERLQAPIDARVMERLRQ